MNAADKLIQNCDLVQAAIVRACHRAGRTAQGVEVMAVTKYASDEDVLSLLAAGKIRHIGESRIQQSLQRWTQPAFAKYNTVKHFIGHLQRNKAALAAKLFDFIDSIDDIRTAEALNEHAARLGKTLKVLVQIKLTARETQSGVSLQEAPSLLAQLRQLPYINPCGYMAIAPQTENLEVLRPLFKQVHAAFERDFPPQGQERYLSLGMSEDFETAVEEGSTLPRVGSKLFFKGSEEL